MHFEILVEGQCDLTTLSILLPKIIGPYAEPHTWKIHKHRGIGKFPDHPEQLPNPKDQTLLHNLPSRLKAYGKEQRDDFVVIVLVDLDDRPDCRAFKQEMLNLLEYCPAKPVCLFRIAIEEIEAWFLGDRQALTTTYPSLDLTGLTNYQQDSQGGTWEKLAQAIKPSLRTRKKRDPEVLQAKQQWAKEITPNMDVERNTSPSFRCFRDGLRRHCQFNRQPRHRTRIAQKPL
ncbi:MAG: DUF4276 family protein [Magnetococcales bacterium]|nr:DUF4276 family protein [Magnetococcales bacterium]